MTRIKFLGLQLVRKCIIGKHKKFNKRKFSFTHFLCFLLICFITTTHKFSIDNCMLNNEQPHDELETVQIEGTGLELPAPENGEYHFES